MSKTIKKIRINAVDIVIGIIFIIFTLTFIFFYSYKQSNISRVINQNNLIEVELLTQVIDNRFVDNLNVGDKLMNYADRAIIGTITEISEISDEWILVSENNKISNTSGKVLKVKYIGNAVYNGNHYLLNDERTVIGETYSYVSPMLEFSAECISLHTVDNNNDGFVIFNEKTSRS